MTIEEIWGEIDQVLGTFAPHILGKLSDPVDPGRLAEAERILGNPVPAQLQGSLRSHDGELQECWIFSTWSLLTLQGILKHRSDELQRSSDAEVDSDEYCRAVVWSPRWVPFAYDGSGGFLLVDGDPTSAGCVGQIISTAHDSGNRRIALDLLEFMARYRDALRMGVFRATPSALEVQSGYGEWFLPKP